MLPLSEQKFAAGWGRMVHIIGAACFPTDLVTLKQDGGGFLPLEILLNEDTTHWTANVSIAPNYDDACRQRTILATFDLVDMQPWKLQRMIGFWKRVAYSEEISRRLPRVIVNLCHGTVWTKLRQLGLLMNLFFRPREKLALLAGLSIPLLFTRLLP